MIWKDSLLDELYERMYNSSLHNRPSYASIAIELGDRLGQSISKEQVRSALRRHRRNILASTSERSARKATRDQKRADESERASITAYVGDDFEFITPSVRPSRSVEEFNPDLGIPDLEPFFAKSLKLAFPYGVLVIADVHVPYQSSYMFRRLMEVANTFGICDLVIAGDLTTQDALSKHPNNQPVSMGTHDELLLAGKYLVALANRLATIGRRVGRTGSVVIVNGNHDERIAKKLDTDFRLSGLVNYMLDGQVPEIPVITTEYDYVNASVGRNEIPWKFGHLSKYSRRGGEAARKVSEADIAKSSQCNVAAGHDHIQGFTTTSNGKYIAMSIGSMIAVDDDGNTSMWYSERRMSDFPPVANGFLMISEDGIPVLFNREGTSCLNGSETWEQFLAS